MSEPKRFNVTRTIPAPPEEVFAVLRDPRGHLAIDASGMLQDVEGDPVGAVGDRFLVHMDREPLNDIPQMGRYDVTVVITEYERDRQIAWTIDGTVQPPLRHIYGYTLEPDGDATRVTSYYDWSQVDPERIESSVFPVIPEVGLRATLGILDRTVRLGLLPRR
ncbi:SRPBCC family protein [Flexivirga alba]|uniref:SRPBCC family protein n=1 Tax=Flexivirga alba TaxID=702742 RepID=A0ABW2ADQ0_9MICO